MCVIYACMKNGSIPSLSELKKGEECNPHGGGVMWYERGPNGKSIPTFMKGLKASQIHEVINTKKPPFAIHFRTASIGPPIPELTHPFPVIEGVPSILEGQAPALLMHNGTWSDYRDTFKMLKKMGPSLIEIARGQILGVLERYENNGGPFAEELRTLPLPIPFPEGEMSDSRAMAWIAHNFGGSTFLEDLLNSGQKIAYMDEEKFRIWPSSSWHVESGYWMSSYTYSCSGKGGGGYRYNKGWESPTPTSYASLGLEDEGEEEIWAEHSYNNAAASASTFQREMKKLEILGVPLVESPILPDDTKGCFLNGELTKVIGEIRRGLPVVEMNNRVVVGA